MTKGLWPRVKRPQAHFLLIFRVIPLSQVQDDLHTPVDAQHAGVQGDVVVLGHAPLPVGVVLIVHPAAGVLVLQPLLRGLLRLAVQPDDAVGPEGDGGVDEGVQAEADMPPITPGVPRPRKA